MNKRSPRGRHYWARSFVQRLYQWQLDKEFDSGFGHFTDTSLDFSRGAIAFQMKMQIINKHIVQNLTRGYIFCFIFYLRTTTKCDQEI